MDKPFSDMPFRHLLWRLTKPVRIYISHFPVNRGKGLLLRKVVIPILPGRGAGFIHTARTGNRVQFLYREALGRDVLLNNGFENTERAVVCALAQPGTTAFDVGANIGVFTVDLAAAVGPAGSVIAVEPVEESVARISENVRLNGFENVELVMAAAGASEGHIDIVETNDSAFNTTTKVTQSGIKSQRVKQVKTETLNSIWIKAGRPRVTVIKIDVEGAELGVLNGASELLKSHHPVLMLEANTSESLEELKTFLSQFGYNCVQPLGFMPWNYLFRYGA